MDASAYAFVHGVRGTRATLAEWNRRPWPVLRAWFAGSLLASIGLLLAVWVIASIAPPSGFPQLDRPPIRVGAPLDVTLILGRNSLVLALHAMACVAGFIAGASLPMQARERRGIARALHEHGGRFAILFVVAATAFSLGAQAYILGRSVATVAPALHTSPGLLLLALLPHALPELTALFLPLAAWIIASRRGDWDKLLAATFVTVLIAVPVLVVAAVWEVYVAPHVIAVVAQHPFSIVIR
jgi:stage II sporulation SpoM-like protein